MWLLQASTFSQVSALHQLSMRGWLAAIFVSVVACVLCYSVLYWLLNHLEGHRLALFEGLHTVSATLFGVLIFKEPVNGLMVFGGGLILAGLIVGNLPQLTEPPGCKIDEAG
jgi:drug/metabolite transporter (DMT)-like permease